MTKIVTTYISSRFNAPAEAPAEYLEKCIDHLKTKAGPKRKPHGIIMDETFAPHMGPLRELLRPMGYVVTHSDEYLIAWEQEVIARRMKKSGITRRMSNVYTGRGRWQDADLFTQRLKIRATGAPIVLEGLHSASSVEFGSHWRPGDRAKAHRQSYDRWGRLIARRDERVTTIAGHDANVNMRTQVWNDRIEKSMGIPTMYSFKTFSAGTHRNLGAKTGGRGIDAINTNGTFLNAGLMPWATPRHMSTKGIDHRGVWAAIDVPDPTKK